MKRMIKLTVVISLLLGVLCILFLWAYIVYFTKPEVIYTTDIEEYYKKTLYHYSDIFPEALPENAQLVNFFYYNYWKDNIEVFLEIEFDSKEFMESFLDLHQKQCQEKYKKKYESTPFFEAINYCFTKKENPYKKSYTDLYHMTHTTSTVDKEFTGYRIDLGEDTAEYTCNFGVISYSYEDLRVVFAYVRGSFHNNVHYYTPAYFVRFEVPVTQKIECYIYIDE